MVYKQSNRRVIESQVKLVPSQAKSQVNNVKKAFDMSPENIPKKGTTDIALSQVF